MLVITLTAPLAACALDTDDTDDTDDVEGELSEPDKSDAEEAAALDGWVALDLDGVPAGAAMTTAAAAPGFPCPRDFACLYQNHNGGGAVVGIRSGFGLPDLRQLDFSDQASSWRNRSGRRYCWYRDINFNGPLHKMATGRQANIVGAPNNEASSFKPC